MSGVINGEIDIQVPDAYRNRKVVVAWVALRLSEFGLVPIPLLCDEHLHLLCISLVAHKDTVACKALGKAM